MRETWVRSLVGKIPWRRVWQPTPVFLPGESPWTRGAWWVTVHKVTKSLIWLSDEALLILNPVCFLLSLYKTSRFLFIMFWNNCLTPLLKTWLWILYVFEFDMIDQGGVTWKPLSNYSWCDELSLAEVGTGRQLPVKEVQAGTEEIQGQSQKACWDPNHVTAGGKP